MTGLGALVTALLVAASPDPFAELPPGTPIRTYVVQPGDSPWSIATEFYGSGDKYGLIYKYNGFVGLPPYLLSPGQVLRLPVLTRGPEAQIEWLRRDVKAKPPRALDWLEARENMNLWRLYRVSTGDASAAHIVFEDTSDLRLREQALLVIYGASASAATTARSDKHEVVLEHGTIQGGLAKLDAAAQPPAPLVVKTPSGEVDILGKLTQVQAEALTSMISALDGAARVSAKGATVEVAEGQGTVVEKGKAPEKPRPLPTAPPWEDPAPALVVALPGEAAPSWEARWLPVAGAASYRVELALDGDFKNVSYDAEVGSGVTRLRLEALSFGKWAVRVSTRDAAKLESKPGAPRQILVTAAAASRRVTPIAPGKVEAVGLLQLHAPDGVTVALDDGEPAGSALLLPGPHRVTWSNGSARAEGAVDIVPVAAILRAAPRPVARGDGEPMPLRLELRDAHGEPALVPGLVLESTAHGELPTTTDGAFTSAVLPPVPADGPRRLKVRARYPGGVLVERELAVVPPADAPTVAGHAWSPIATTPWRHVRGLAQPAAPTSPTTAVGIETGLADLADTAGASDGGLALELALGGELALAGGDLALEGGLLFQGLRLGDAAEPQAAPGDAWLGARWRAVSGGVVELAPYLRAALPVGRGETPRVVTLEPGLALRFHLGDDGLFDLRAAGLVRAGSDAYDTAAFDGLAALAWGPVALSYRGVLDGGALLSTVGLGVTLPLGAVRLGLAAGYGLDARARERLGGLSGRLVLDVGL